MGRGIAHVAALNGFEVILQDVSQEALKEALSTIEKELELLSKITTEDKHNALQNIRTTLFLTDLSDVGLAIESVPEDLNIKLAVFKELDQLCAPETIFASNTTSQSITAIASVTKRPDKVIGMHFFNPVHKMKLVEIIKGLETSEETAVTIEEIAAKMGKETVRIKEFPGFVTSRLNALIGNEAFNMLMEGLGKPEDIDKAVKLGLNHPMGPFEMVDLVGLDVRLKSLEYLYKTLGEKYRPCPLHLQYVAAGRLGRKAGKGVYEYDAEGRRIEK